MTSPSDPINPTQPTNEGKGVLKEDVTNNGSKAILHEGDIYKEGRAGVYPFVTPPSTKYGFKNLYHS